MGTQQRRNATEGWLHQHLGWCKRNPCPNRCWNPRHFINVKETWGNGRFPTRSAYAKIELNAPSSMDDMDNLDGSVELAEKIVETFVEWASKPRQSPALLGLTDEVVHKGGDTPLGYDPDPEQF